MGRSKKGQRRKTKKTPGPSPYPPTLPKDKAFYKDPSSPLESRDRLAPGAQRSPQTSARMRLPVIYTPGKTAWTWVGTKPNTKQTTEHLNWTGTRDMYECVCVRTQLQQQRPRTSRDGAGGATRPQRDRHQPCTYLLDEPRENRLDLGGRKTNN